MQKSVSDAWYHSIVSYEGYTDWLYFDTHNPPLATTGIGNMIDAGGKLSAFGLALPWRYKNKDYATEKQVAGEYTRLKALGINKQGGYAYQSHAELFLDEDDVVWLLFLKTDEFWDILKGTFPDIEFWPADAQLALMNMAWWMGPAFTQSWPNLTAALKAKDFLKASTECTTQNPSKRNPDNVHRFVNAAKVMFTQSDVKVLYDKQDAPGVTQISAAAISHATSTTAVTDIEYVQRMLTVAGDYAGPIDGLRGTDTNNGLRAWAKSQNISYKSDIPTLTKLSNSTLKMSVVA